MSAGWWQTVPVPDVDWTAVLRADDGSRMRDPAGASAISAAESALGVVFPGDLRALYLVSDGVFDEPGQWFIIWPLAEVVARNQAARAGESTTRLRLLAFGDDGTGAPFCVPVGAEPGSSSGTLSWTKRPTSHTTCGHFGKHGPLIRCLHTNLRSTAHKSTAIHSRAADRINRSGAGTRPAVMHWKDPSVTVSHPQTFWKARTPAQDQFG
jgi:hypothetical protein